MTSQLDLDQSGTFRTIKQVYCGPSAGWTNIVSAILPVNAAGVTNIQRGNALIQVSVNAAVTLNLPPAKALSGGAMGQPQLFATPRIVIVDLGGFAGANPITINAAAGELIDGLASILLNSPFGSYTLLPNVNVGGWYITTD